MTTALIPQDLLDGEDLYNLSMGALAQRWPNAVVTYKYTNRAGTKFRKGFARELRAQLKRLSKLRLTDEMFDYLVERTPWLPRPFLQWLGSYKFTPKQVKIKQTGGALEISITGRWYEVIFWEVKLLSIISQLHYTNPETGELPPLKEDWEAQIHEKARKLSEAGVRWIDFGTRRRFSFEVQDAVVRIMKQYPGFLGTSNPYLAMKHGVQAVGTYAHQLPMAMQALYGPRAADKMAMEHWVELYRGDLGTALSDTLTTENFLKAFDSYYAHLFTGVRQDSGDPIEFGERMIEHYKKLRIDPTTKTIVFSDGLTPEKAIEIHKHFEGRIRTVFGIGTNFTADILMTGVPPISHVIKLLVADFGHGPVDLVKLSDDPGKHTGEKSQVAAVKRILGLAR